VNKCIIVGGTSGIGKALAELLLRHGYKVVLTGVERDDLSPLQETYTATLTVDYFDCIQIKSSVRLTELTETLGGLDLLIFSAGIGHLNKNLGFEVENYANKLNVLAFTEVVDWSYRYFERQGHGHLVAISSITGLFGYGNAPAYNAAKAYQITYLEGLRQKAMKSGNRFYVSDIRPGFVDTDISRELKTFWLATPEKAARQIFNIIKQRKPVGYVTKRWVLIAIVIKLIPDWIRVRL